MADCSERDNVIFRGHEIGGFTYLAGDLLLAGSTGKNELPELNKS